MRPAEYRDVQKINGRARVRRFILRRKLRLVFAGRAVPYQASGGVSQHKRQKAVLRLTYESRVESGYGGAYARVGASLCTNTAHRLVASSITQYTKNRRKIANASCRSSDLCTPFSLTSRRRSRYTLTCTRGVISLSLLLVLVLLLFQGGGLFAIVCVPAVEALLGSLAPSDGSSYLLRLQRNASRVSVMETGQPHPRLREVENAMIATRIGRKRHRKRGLPEFYQRCTETIEDGSR